MTLNPKSRFAPFDKSNDMPSAFDNDANINSRLDDLEQRVSALEKDEASEQDIDSTSNDEDIAGGPRAAGKGLGRI
jgi:hypothetical protein